MTEFRTYLPVVEDVQLYRNLRCRDYECLAAPIAARYPYERVGFDRLLAILVDLEELEILPPASVLDIGCNVGLFSLALAAVGYRVTGVDSNIAADVQGFYPDRVLSIARDHKDMLALDRLDLVEADVADHLSAAARRFDVCLLLSVVHQWRAGYASSGIGVKADGDVVRLLTLLASRTNRALYYEGMDDAHLRAVEGVRLPDWFVARSLASTYRAIAVSPAANGEFRTLYRIEI